MRLRGRRPVTIGERHRGLAKGQLGVGQRRREDPSRPAWEPAAFRVRVESPLEVCGNGSDVRSVGGMGLAAFAMQQVPRSRLEPLYGEGTR